MSIRREKVKYSHFFEALFLIYYSASLLFIFFCLKIVYNFNSQNSNYYNRTSGPDLVNPLQQAYPLIRETWGLIEFNLCCVHLPRISVFTLYRFPLYGLKRTPFTGSRISNLENDHTWLWTLKEQTSEREKSNYIFNQRSNNLKSSTRLK